MRKNSKNDTIGGASTTASDAGPEASAVTAPAKKQAKAGAKSARKTSAKKASAKVAVKKPAAPKRARSAKPTGPSEADIRLRAYFIAERRVQLALQGDPARDWLEARRQLLDEAGQGQA